MKIERKEHLIYKELKQYKGKYIPSQLIGRWQYIYSSSKGKISLIKLLNYLENKKHLWEIYCLEGNLFEDIKRFNSKIEAEKSIKKILLGEKMKCKNCGHKKFSKKEISIRQN